MKNWSFEQDAAGHGVITHHALPRFSAQWTSGTVKRAVPPEVCWHDAGSGEDDSLHLFGFQWIDLPPEAEAFERLMQQAAKAIDGWIASRL